MKRMAAAVDKTTVAGRVRRVIADSIGLEESDVTPSALLADDLGMDSLDGAEVVMDLEAAFKIEIDDNECAEVIEPDEKERRRKDTGRVSGLIALVEAKLAAKAKGVA